MESLSSHLQNMELKPSDDTRPYAVKQAEWRNAEDGSLNEIDGVNCPICKNKGVIYIADPPNPVLIQKPCECMTKRKSVTYAKNSGLKDLLNHRVSTYETKEPWQLEIKKLAAEYVQDRHTEWFCMFGQSGVGKTHICSAIAKTFIDRVFETKYVVWNAMAREIKSDMLNYNQALYMFQKVSVLYIDDFLKGKYNETDITMAFDLLNYRYNNSLTTIITSELSFGKLMEIDGAVAGRIKEMAGKFFIEILKDDAKNYRLK